METVKKDHEITTKSYASSHLTQFPNLDMVYNVKKDTVLYELPPKPSRKRSRPKKYGKQLFLKDISLSEHLIGAYNTEVQMVLSNLFGE